MLPNTFISHQKNYLGLETHQTLSFPIFVKEMLIQLILMGLK